MQVTKTENLTLFDIDFIRKKCKGASNEELITKNGTISYSVSDIKPVPSSPPVGLIPIFDIISKIIQIISKINNFL